jgi:hypothetical protein
MLQVGATGIEEEEEEEEGYRLLFWSLLVRVLVQTNTGMILRIGHDSFLLNYFQLNTYLPSCHPTVYIL